MQQAANETLSQLCNNSTWRSKTTSGTNAEWLEFTNQLIEEYDLGISNVRELLLHLGPKVQTSVEPDPTPVKTFLRQFSCLNIDKSNDIN